MATTTAPTTASTLADGALLRNTRKQRSLWGNAWGQFRRHRPAMVGLFVIIFFVIFCFVGIFFWDMPHNSPYVYETNVRIGGNSTVLNLTTFEDETQFHPLGTDEMGQDMLARIMFGGRISLSVGIVAALISIAVGTAIGAAAGFYGGFVDSVLMRITDLFISLPTLPLLLLITFLFKSSVNKWADNVFGSPMIGTFLLIVGVISILAWMTTARLVRASFLSVKEKEFIEAARSIGANEASLIFRQILPNVLSPIIVAATLQVGASIITESSLSFLGLGFPYDVPTWGAMLFNAKDQMQFNPKLALLPGTMIFLTVLAINFIGDGLRDALDPRKSS
jgi:peptide/nickel transport system permease protein